MPRDCCECCLANLQNLARVAACSKAPRLVGLAGRGPSRMSTTRSKSLAVALAWLHNPYSRKRLRRRSLAWFRSPDAGNADRSELIEAVFPPCALYGAGWWCRPPSCRLLLRRRVIRTRVSDALLCPAPVGANSRGIRCAGRLVPVLAKVSSPYHATKMRLRCGVRSYG